MDSRAALDLCFLSTNFIVALNAVFMMENLLEPRFCMRGEEGGRWEIKTQSTVFGKEVLPIPKYIPIYPNRKGKAGSFIHCHRLIFL